jgi:uncharacterized membrane protein YecN with MAPEG domain
MIEVPVTLATASILGIFYILLSMAVSEQRRRTKIGLGNGADSSVALGAENTASGLFIAVRRHGQFAEYVPLSLVLILLLELSGVPRAWLLGLAAALVLARIMVTAGLGRPAPNVLRAGGASLQMLMILVACIYGLVLAASHV